jgi:hypothetical protein
LADGRSLDVIALLATTDSVKLSAIQAILLGAAIQSLVFDRAAGMLWTSIIPLRLMIATEDGPGARRALSYSGWVAASDGEWDFVEA